MHSLFSKLLEQPVITAYLHNYTSLTTQVIILMHYYKCTSYPLS